MRKSSLGFVVCFFHYYSFPLLHYRYALCPELFTQISYASETQATITLIRGKKLSTFWSSPGTVSIHAGRFHKTQPLCNLFICFGSWTRCDMQKDRYTGGNHYHHLKDSCLFVYLATALQGCSTKSRTGLPRNTAGLWSWASFGNHHGGVSQWVECLGISCRSTWPPKQLSESN